MNPLPEGLVLVCKRDCPTCTLIEPVFSELAAGEAALTILTQDDPDFPSGMFQVVDDSELAHSFHLGIEIVPTLIRVQNGREAGRVQGWNKQQWRDLTGIDQLGAGLPAHRPGCGSRTLEPGVPELLARRYGQRPRLEARRIKLAELEDDVESCFEQGWTDGLPVVPPTEARVRRMLEGTRCAPDSIVAIVPPDQIPCTVEKIAINAVMAGCKPEYMPVVLAAVEAACLDDFCLHGVLATTYFSSPVVIVNGPVARAIGMNAGVNALGQGNRANATIGRALQLVIRNVGGGRPGGVDRAVLGNPGKYTFCFAENEADSPWEPLSQEMGFGPEDSTVTLFAGDGVQGVMDQLSRTPDSLARSFAASLRVVCHAKIVMAADALLVVSPEHARVFREAGWSKARLKSELVALLELPASELRRGAAGIAEGMPDNLLQDTLPKFRPGGLLIVHAGGEAGLFSAIVGGWAASGPKGSQPVTLAVTD